MDENTGPMGVGAAKQPTKPMAKTSRPVRRIRSQNRNRSVLEDTRGAPGRHR
jgi:hypothetical protein